MSMRNANCSCCGSSQLLRHIRQGGLYWFCMSCRQESILPKQKSTTKIIPVSLPIQQMGA